MPSNDERWLDAEAGPVVRPYALTQGRTRHAGESFDLVATVMATPAALTEPAALAKDLKAHGADTVIGPLNWDEKGDLKGFEFGVFQWHADGSSSAAK